MCDAANDWYQNTVFLGANEALRELGATVVMYNGGILGASEPADRDRNALFGLIDPERIDGLLVLAPVGDALGSDALSAFCWRYARLPVCSVAIELAARPGVLVDNAGGMGKLVEHLVLVHRRRRIAFVRGPVASAEAQGRYEVYRDTLARHGIPFDPALVAIGDFRVASGIEAVRVLCDERNVRFDALVAANDNMALGAMEALQARGLSVPEISVAGFDDMQEGRFATPPLTTVRQPIRESGRQAGRLLMALLKNEIGPARVTLRTELVLRESCGCTADDGGAHQGPAHFIRVAGLLAHLRSHHGDIALTLGGSVPSAQIPCDWPEPLLDAFISDLGDAAGQRFASFLLATLCRVTNVGGSVRPWNAVISVLRSEVMRCEGDSAGLDRASELLHRARVIVGDLHENAQAQHRLSREQWIRRLHETSEVLSRAFGEDALVEAIESQLPRWEIPASAICVYDRTTRRPLTRARPLFLYDDGRRIACSREVSFPAHELAPAGWLDARARTLIAEPLVSRGEQFGFSLFEMGAEEGEVYEGLRRLISSAMKGAWLLEQVVAAATDRQRAERERLEKEMEIAARIQTSLVLKAIVVPGLEIAATMIPASEVGGDYYDVVPFPGGCWMGIGDVAGHGLQTGLVMLIIQSVVSALVRDDPRASPRDAVRILNSVMFDSVRQRMGQDEHSTLLLLRYDGDGRFTHSGAHEEIVVYRASRVRCERIEVLGPVLGAVPEIGSTLSDRTLSLEPADLLVLYTDGLVEAMSARGETFGVERLCELLEAHADEPASAIRDHIIEVVRSWSSAQSDDMSLVVVRRT